MPLSLLCFNKKHPAELKFVLVDPKKVEFSIYSVIEHHFLAKLPDGEDAIITDVTKVSANVEFYLYRDGYTLRLIESCTCA